MSAYLNKVIEKPENLFVAMFCKKPENCYMNNASFSDFVDFILNQYQESDCYKHYNRSCNHVNEHWRPFNARCSYCDITYNVIGRVETFDEDLRYILLKQNLTKIIIQADVHNQKSLR